MGVLTCGRPGLSRSVRALGWALPLVAAIAGAPLAAQEGQRPEVVKAAYLLAFTRYIERPAPGPAAGTPLTVCVLGRDPFGPVLEQTIGTRRSLGREVRVARPASAARAPGCSIAYVAGEPGAEAQPWLAALSGHPVLTVGEGPEFTAGGGMIACVTVDETIRFEINVAALRAAGLQLSSRVLALAVRVTGAEASP